MAATVEPEELARILDVAERPRSQGWSLRAALTRYGQPQPERASAIIELVRRIESALRPHTKLLEREGEALWAAVHATTTTEHAFVVDVLRALVELDRLGDVLASWAVDRVGARPDAEVDTVLEDVTRRLTDLGVEREERPRPTPRRA